METSIDVRDAAAFVGAFRSLYSEMPMQQAHLLLLVATKPGITMAELSEELDMAQSSTSRNVAALSKFHRLGQPGLNMVEAASDPRDPRRRIIFLTNEGKAFVTQLLRTLNPDFSLGKDTDARVAIEEMHKRALSETGEKRQHNRRRPAGK